ncbi:hypothetical protein LINPERHAP1_LOCUS20468 [Linum perenne]
MVTRSSWAFILIGCTRLMSIDLFGFFSLDGFY